MESHAVLSLRDGDTYTPTGLELRKNLSQLDRAKYVHDTLLLLCGYASNWERRLIMFQAFWDESGTHARDLLILAGFVGTAEKWVTFTERGQLTLTRYDMDRTGIHMKDFNNYTSGRFKHLDHFQRTALYCELLAIIKDTVSIGFVCTVHQQEFDTLVPAKFRSDHIGTPYALLTQTGVEVVSDWARREGSQQPVGHMFEDGHSNAKQAFEHLNKVNSDRFLKEKYLLGPYSFERKESFLPLQAADLLAWSSYGSELNQQTKTVNLPGIKRGPLDAFGIPTQWMHCEKQYLKALVREASRPKRSRR
jgi:Protein of unknown function (DUF3800)